MTIPHVEEKKANFLRSGLEVNSLAKLVSFTKNKKVETLENIGLSQGNFDNIKKQSLWRLHIRVYSSDSPRNLTSYRY